MDGLSNSESKTFVSTFQGKFVVRVPEGTQGAKSRQTKSGKTVWELQFTKLEGYLSDMERVEREYEGIKYDTLKLHFATSGKPLILNLSFKGGLSNQFFLRMENIDYTQLVTFETSLYDERQYLFIKQNKEVVPAKYTKENPGNKPAWQPIEINGEKHWDRTEEFAFYMNILETVIKPKLSASGIFQKDPAEITAEPKSVVDDNYFPGTQDEIPTTTTNDTVPF